MRPVKEPKGNAIKSTKPAPVEPENLAVQHLPPVPKGLTRNGQAVWYSVWDAGGDSYSVKTDAYVIERYATLHVRRDELMQMLSDEGMVSVGSQGQQVLHPAARYLSDVETSLSKLEDKLGLNPEARIRLGISAIEKESKLDQFMKGTNS